MKPIGDKVMPMSWQSFMNGVKPKAKGLPTLIVFGACLLFVLTMLRQGGWNPTYFIDYDGYFSSEIALHGFEVTPVFDKPAYRFQRILYPMVARSLALARPELIPWMLIMVNMAAITIGTWLTEELLDDLGTSRWYALIYGLYGGQFVALRTNLNEPMAQMLVAWAMLAYSRERRGWAIFAFALAGLTKETALIFGAAYALYHLWLGQWRWAVSFGLTSLPYFLYQFGIEQWLGQSGFAASEPFFWIPLQGWFQASQVNFLAFLLISIPIVPMSILPTLAGLALSLRSLWQGLIQPIVFCLLLHGLFILFLPSLTFIESSAMVRVTQGLVVSMVLYGALVKSGRILNYSFLWIFTNVLWVYGTG